MDVCLTWSDNIDEWTKRVRRDGKWFEPNWWLDECYIVRSPYSRQEIEAAFQQLQNVFSPQVFLKLLGTGKLDTPKGMLATLESINPIPLGLATRHQTMAADSPNIFGLDVGDPITLGLDLDTTWQRSKPLIRRLRTHKGYFGARWELSVMAV